MGTATKTPQVEVRFSVPMTREQAQAIYRMGQEAVIFVLMQLGMQAAQAAQANRPSGGQGQTAGVDPLTPSGMVPPHLKPAAAKRRKKPGAKAGHPGARRPAAPITRHEEHPPLERCPHCGGAVGAVAERRFRIIEDIVETQPEATEHSIPRHWCAQCGKMVEPPVPDALPGATLGHRAVALTSWLHYGLGTTISQIAEVLNHYLHLPVSEGGLVSAWQRTADVLEPWYEQIGEEALTSAVLHADETGWRQNGRTVWLWCFTWAQGTYYMIDPSRGEAALAKFFKEEFAGVLVTDFWAAYNKVVCAARQTCIPHLLRDVQRVSLADTSAEWTAFAKKLTRLFRDAIRLPKDEELPYERFELRRERIHRRLDDLIEGDSAHKDIRRLVNRMRGHRDDLLTFLDADLGPVPADNNHAEREIRPAVMMRKVMQGNRSERGSRAQAALMSIYRTLKLRGHDPLASIVGALRTWVSTGHLPLLPRAGPSDG